MLFAAALSFFSYLFPTTLSRYFSGFQSKNRLKIVQFSMHVFLGSMSFSFQI